MKKSFTFGVLSGFSALALAVPVLAQLSSAQTTESASSTSTFTRFIGERPPLTADQIQEHIDRDSAFLTNADAMLATVKSATMTHRAALTAAAAITDETERQTAVQEAEVAFHTTLKTEFEAHPDWKMAMPFGPGMGGHHGKMMRMRGPGHLAEKLGMSEDELKAALEGGKTIEQIAEEKGVELPAHKMMFFKKIETDTDAGTSSVQ